MKTPGPRPSRRAALALSAGTAMAAAVSSGGTAHAASAGRAPGPRHGISRALRELEREHSARLGVFAHNSVTGTSVLYRADETFPICSVFKTVAVAAVLRDLDQYGEFLGKRVRYTEQDVQDSGYAPVTGEPANLERGMTVGELCGAAVSHSDNTAANLLLRELGGPTAVTRFSRSVGDRATRLDRWEPELNSAEPWRTTDTTTPGAIGRTYARLALGRALRPRDRKRLTDWLLASTTGGARLRAGLPEGWTLADKTGTGEFGTTNDVGVAWKPDGTPGTPLVLAVMSTKDDADAPADEPLIAKTAALLAKVL